MVFGPRGHTHEAPNLIILDFGDTKLLQIIQAQTQIPLTKHYFGKSQNLENRKHHIFGKDACQKVLEIRLMNS